MITNDMNVFMILVSSLLVNNILLIRFLALCSFFGLSNKVETSLGMGMAVIFVMVNASAVTWLLYRFLLAPLHLEYLRTSSSSWSSPRSCSSRRCTSARTSRPSTPRSASTCR